jgi:uncharacterized protein YbjT (DUF2867 family)/membrane protease YdiL (CAAX protease family)
MSDGSTRGTVLLTGATGFVGRHAHDALVARGWQVRCATRGVEAAQKAWPDRDWVSLYASDEASVRSALTGCRAALYMIHGMASHEGDFRSAEIRQAEAFARAAADAGVERIVYLGGVAAPRDASEHLRSREEVGEALRAGAVPTIELRASMIVGHGSLSWLMVRDLAARLPVMILPKWLESRTEPISIDDVVVALLHALEMEASGSEWFDIPGPEVLSGRDILERTADAFGVPRAFMIQVPFLTPRLSSHWVRFVTRAQWSVAREIVVGLKTDLVAHDDRFWGRIGHQTRQSFDEAAHDALVEERRGPRIRGPWGVIERIRVGPRATRSEGEATAGAPTATETRTTDTLALTLALLWSVGALIGGQIGLWGALGTTAVVLGTAAVLLDGRALVGRRPTLPLVALGASVGLGMALATVGLYEPVTGLLPELQNDVERLYDAFRAPGPWLTILLLPVVVTFEEVVWRGAVHTALVRRMSWVWAAGVGGLVYAAAHVPTGSTALVLASLGAGLCWSTLRAWTDSLAPSLAAHLVWNFAVLVIYQLA